MEDVNYSFKISVQKTFKNIYLKLQIHINVIVNTYYILYCYRSKKKKEVGFVCLLLSIFDIGEIKTLLQRNTEKQTN